MNALRGTSRRLRNAEILSGVPISKELRKRVRESTSSLSRAPCLAVVLVGDRADSLRYINHKKRAAKECGIVLRLVQLPSSIRQKELHESLAAVNNDVAVDGVILQLPLPPHLRARPALFHIHPGKDVDGLHPLNAGNLFLQDQSPLIHAFAPAPSSQTPRFASQQTADEQAQAFTREMLLLTASGCGYNGGGSSSSCGCSVGRRRSHESMFFVPCTALAIRTLLFLYLGRTAAYAHLRLPETPAGALSKPHDALRDLSATATAAAPSPAGSLGAAPGLSSTTRRRELHAVIVNKSMVVGVPTAALLQRAGGFIVTLCSRSNSVDAIRSVTQNADVLISAYGAANIFDRTFVKEGAIVIDAAINELPPAESSTGEGNTEPTASPSKRRSICGDVMVDSVSPVVAAIATSPGGVGPLTVSHLMSNVLKAYQLRHANHLYYNNIYTEFLKMYGTQEKVRDYAPHLSTALTLNRKEPTTAAAVCAPASTAVAPIVPPASSSAVTTAPETTDAVRIVREGSAVGVAKDQFDTPDDDADVDNESYWV